MRRAAHLLLALAIATALLAACSYGTTIDEHPCPPGGTTLTYENFGDKFFSTNCVRCHGAANGYSSRSFTTIDDIRASRDRIFVNAAADNDAMPPGPDGPSQDDRNKLAEWLACGAP
jgi:hypothetical protein